MADRYGSSIGGLLPSRAIYPASRFGPYLILLVVSKFMRAFGFFLSYDILKVVHVVQFLCIVKLGSAVVLVLLQRPFSSGPKITKHQWLRISRHAVFGCIINLLWFFGLTLCGPLRTILLFEHSELVMIAGASALFTSAGGGPAKLRGAVFFLIAVVSLLLFDNDDIAANMEDKQHHLTEANHQHSSIITHTFYHITSWIGLSDHKGGVFLLFITLCMNTVYTNVSKKLSIAVGGAKRLHAISTLMSFFLLLPWALFIYFTKVVEKEVSSMSLVLPFLVATLVIFVLDYYIEAVATNRLEAVNVAKYGSISIFVSGLILSLFWSEAYKAKVTIHHHIQEIIAEEHALSGGVIFSIILIIFATTILTSPSRGSRGSFIGYSSSGQPLYSFAGDALQRTSHSVIVIAKNGLKQILENSDSRQIFYFLCINLLFTFVELVYGVWTNSLGLISDGFHMLFDCSALVMGLYAAVMSRWKATRIFSYGYDRIEVLSGFINGLFLTTIAFFVFTTALGRVFDPPEINTDRLLTVSVLGLLVNLIGICAFRHAHSHGHGHSHGGGHGHSHAPAGQGHGHSHGGHGHSHGSQVQVDHPHHNTNMEGVFLHVLADTLGSVGVIISSILIENFGWNIADPICSLFIAVMIFLSVIPLLKEASLIMLLRTPIELQKELGQGLQKVLSIEGVTSYRQQHFWQHSSKVYCGMLHIHVSPDAAEQKIIKQVTAIFKEIGINNMTVQVEKEAFFQHMSGLGMPIERVQPIDKTTMRVDFDSIPVAIKSI
ncbi:proton-coupled zinc antiporter SLC30A5-like isoform X2 [Lineus longissimus]|uniref:proton-coupled zinc antiporter SLC30A5-like isoform X2 n=1 Tax=Lineus longissimus TaxID=88925 RepID=UPI00315C667A